VIGLYLVVVDGKVKFASHIIKVIDTEKFKSQLAERGRDRLRIPFQVQNDCIICYSNKERLTVMDILDQNEIRYSIQTIEIPPQMIELSQQKEYSSRSEAMKCFEELQ